MARSPAKGVWVMTEIVLMVIAVVSLGWLMLMIGGESSR
jgi:hypothetical protein